jgi:hypothetical protein
LTYAPTFLAGVPSLSQDEQDAISEIARQARDAPSHQRDMYLSQGIKLGTQMKYSAGFQQVLAGMRVHYSAIRSQAATSLVGKFWGAAAMRHALY